MDRPGIARRYPLPPLSLQAGPVAIFLPWSLFLLFGHQPWFDELQAWEIAVNSATPLDLFWNLKHEGHPILWYLVLWAASFVNPTMITLKIVHLLVTLLFYWLIAVKSPFSALEKILIYANFFVLCEYGTISRSYCLGVVLVLLYAWLLTDHRRRLLLRVVVLGALANISAFTALLSFVLLAHEVIFERGQSKLAAAIGLYLALALAAAVTMYPAGDIAAIDINVDWLQRLIIQVNMFVSFPFIPKVSADVPPDSPGYLIVGLLFGVIWCRAYGLGRKYTFIWAGSAALFIAFGTLIYAGRIWHGGLMLSVLLLCFWLAAGPGAARIRHVAALLLMPGAVIGLGISMSMATQPFSHAADVAAWLTSQGHRDDLIVGAPGGETAVTIGAMLGQPIFDPGCRCRPKFMVWSRGTMIKTADVAPVIADEMRRRHTAQALLILPQPDDGLPDWLTEAPQFSTKTLARFTGALRSDGDYAIIQVTMPQESGGLPAPWPAH